MADVAFYTYLLLNVLGLAEPIRIPSTGLSSPEIHRPANGTIEELESFVPLARERVDLGDLGVKVFRGAAAKANGFNLECFLRGGDPLATFEEELEGQSMMVFRDVTNRNSAERMTFADYHQMMREAQADSKRPVPYIRALHSPLKTCRSAIPWETWRQELYGWSSLPDFASAEPLYFFGTNGTYSAMHADVTDSYFVQVYGRKRWIFVDPQYTPRLKPHAQFSNVAYDIGFDPFHEALPPEVFTREVILEPGDILYFPPMTWHAVMNLDPITIGVDMAVPDPVKAFPRNWFLTLATVLNPLLAIRVAPKILTSWSTRILSEVFFEGYTPAFANTRSPLWWTMATCVLAVLVRMFLLPARSTGAK